MYTILPSFLPNAAQAVDLRLAAPLMSIAAQFDASVPIAAIILVVVLIIVVVLWRMSHKPSRELSQPTDKAGELPTPIDGPLPPPPAIISLEFIAGDSPQVSFTLDKPTLTIGRAPDNDIVLAAPILNVDTVSEHHARLRRDQDGYVMRDLASRNGLAVNGRQTLENLLQDGDHVQFGEAEAIFHQPAGGTA